MVKIKRTTVVLPEEIRKGLKYIAVDKDTSFTMVLTAALFYFLDDYKAGKISDEYFEKVKERLEEMKEDIS